MKIIRCIPVICAVLGISFCTLSAQGQTQDSTGLPGDNFSLSGALELFKKSKSPEEFEKALNTESNKVNNLDLNGDGQIDYVRVINKKEGNINIFVIQDVVSEKESQDIAVIDLEKKAANSAAIQIVGDEDMYGSELVIEPTSTNTEVSYVEPPVPVHGPQVNFAGYAIRKNEPNLIFINVWLWPCVQFVYAPGYTLWVSPWSWLYRPVWWHPWRPFAWNVFSPWRYHNYYGIAPMRRMPRAQQFYRSNRVYSPYVQNRNQYALRRYRDNPPPRGNRPPGNRPGQGNNRPGQPGNNRPGQPGNNRPGQPGNNRPGQPGNNRPGQPGNNRPGQPGNNRPGQPGNNRPGQPGNNRPEQPGNNRPGQPGNNRPEQPGNNRPGQPGNNTRPTQPGQQQRPTTRPTQPSQQQRPATRPMQPSHQQRPATRPSTGHQQRPAARPSMGGQQRPAARPSTPNRQPAARPQGGGGRRG